MSQKYFVFDLDGTLLNSRKDISVPNLEALKRIHKEGHHIILATARPPRAVKGLIEKVGIEVSSVYYNGAFSKSSRGTVTAYSIENSTLRSLVPFIESRDNEAIVSVEQNDTWFSYQDFDFKTFFHTKESPQRISRNEFLNLAPTKILINNSRLSREIQEQYSKVCNVIITDQGSLIQLMSLESSKETAVAKILKELKDSWEQVICFGDDHNDVGLFKVSGMSVAMGNAVPELKSIAKHITSTNDDDGVAEFINTFFENRFPSTPKERR